MQYGNTEQPMLQAIGLSDSAVATLRFRVKGYKFPIRERDLESFRELVGAGIMEPVRGPDGNPEADFRFTEDGFQQREEILRDAEDWIERERYDPPAASHLSEAAKSLLRTCITGPQPDGNDTNLPAYRELVKARIMMPMGSFTKGDECVFRFTYWGWKLRFELAGMDRTAKPK
jgi:hypothetical protein